MALATREDLLRPSPRRFKTVELPVKGVSVRIRSLTEGERSEYEAALLTEKGGGIRRSRVLDARRRLIALCVVDGNGDPLLSPDDVKQLAAQDGADMSHLQRECMEHCGFSDTDIEGLVGNSEGESDADSPTD